MKLQESINFKTYLAYKPPRNIEPARKIISENFDWDVNHPKSLAVICIEKLSENWMGYPKLESFTAKDKDLFLQTLDTQVPLQILVDNIKHDIFWKRCYKSRWPDSPLITNEKRWINVFMEKHYADILENMNPRQYDPEKVTFLVKLCGPYIQSLSIRSLIPSDIPVQRTVSPEMADLITSQQQADIKLPKKNEILTRDHISLHAALGSLSNLVELHITYQLRYIDTEYRKDQFQFTNNDAKNLARGLEKCSQLKIVRITRSDMNCQRVKYILRGLSDAQNLDTLDFSHCKIGDEGAASIAKFILRHENLRSLILADNIFGLGPWGPAAQKLFRELAKRLVDVTGDKRAGGFLTQRLSIAIQRGNAAKILGTMPQGPTLDLGPSGVESIAHALNHVGCSIRYLDLRLNNSLGSEGIAHIAVTIARGCNLTSLNISGCGITPMPLTKAPAGVWSITSADSPPTCGDLLARAIGLAKTPLRALDISVNDIGSPSDNSLSNAICLSYLIDVNLKRSGMSSMAMAIGESAAAAQRLRREAEKGIRFRRSAGRVLQARRVAKGMNIDADPILLAQQLLARPSIVSVTSEDGIYCMQTQPLPADFSFVPVIKSPLPSSRTSSITGPPTSRRSSHHMIIEPVKEMRRSALVRRGSDGSLLQSRGESGPRHIKIFVSNELVSSEHY